MSTSQIFKPTPVFTAPVFTTPVFTTPVFTNIVIDSRNMVQVSNYAEFMMEGLENPSIWGYGFRRLKVKISEDNKTHCPYSFTGFSYKEQSGGIFLGMRMNIDQNSPVRFIKWDGHSDIMESLGKLMNGLLIVFVNANKNLN
mgnify:CR=1 FL=1